jgi:hypothetical protein
MNYPFKIKFIIVDENKELTIKQNLLKHFRQILKELFNNDQNYKFLDRVEASVSSIDENKQLRLTMDIHHNFHSLIFHQRHSSVKEYFKIEELKYISEKIQIGLEDFLRYKIDSPIIYIETDYILTIT